MEFIPKYPSAQVRCIIRLLRFYVTRLSKSKIACLYPYILRYAQRCHIPGLIARNLRSSGIYTKKTPKNGVLGLFCFPKLYKILLLYNCWYITKSVQDILCTPTLFSSLLFYHTFSGLSSRGTEIVSSGSLLRVYFGCLPCGALRHSFVFRRGKRFSAPLGTPSYLPL